MNKCWVLVLTIVCVAPGCLGVPPIVDPPRPPAPVEKETPVVARPKRPTTLVTADQVNESNAEEMSKKLWQELDRDSQSDAGQR
jgi:hypothetical protein